MPAGCPRDDNNMPFLLAPQALQDYFDNTWILTESLFAGLQGEEAFMCPPAHGLRHPLIFYYGHVAALYVNKLRAAGILQVRGLAPTDLIGVERRLPVSSRALPRSFGLLSKRAWLRLTSQWYQSCPSGVATGLDTIYTICPVGDTWSSQ